MRSVDAVTTLLCGHLEATVTVYGPPHAVRATDLRADRGGDGEAHRPQPPEFTNVYGWLNFQYCDVHIWC